MAEKKKNWIVIGDDDPTYPLDMFAVPKHYIPSLDRVMIPHGIVLNRIEKIAQNIVEDIQGPLVVLCVLKGGHQVFADLVDFIRKLNTNVEHPLPLTLEFIRLKSYVGTQSSGSVSIQGMDVEAIRGKHVLVVEDIVDTGRSITRLLDALKEVEPASVHVFSLLLKRTPLSNGYIPDYVGFEIPDHFVVGYCLDYNEYYRDLDHLCIINEEGKRKYAQ